LLFGSVKNSFDYCYLHVACQAKTEVYKLYIYLKYWDKCPEWGSLAQEKGMAKPG
jgi:hypothetical protein